MDRNHILLAVLVVIASLLSAGCSNNDMFMTDQRLQRGMVVILPGVEGPSGYNRDIRRGLVSAGVPYALPIRSWGTPIPLLGVFLRQVDIIGAHIAAAGIRDEIIRYQDTHPGAPVYLIGHSGGGAIAVMVAEKMPDQRKVQGLVLLSASISSAHNLTDALNHCEHGIVNFHNTDDGLLLLVGTTLAGNVDRLYGPAAGLIGFDWPEDRHNDLRKQAYARLYQRELTPDMTLGGDPHTLVTRPRFVATYIAPWILRSRWPATKAEMYAYIPTGEP